MSNGSTKGPGFDLPPPADEHGTPEFRIVALRLAVLHGDVSDMKDVLRDLTSAITKLSLIEERQTQASQALDRAFKTLEKVEERVSILEKSAPMNDRNNKWVDRASWAAFGLLVMYVLKKVGFIL